MYWYEVTLAFLAFFVAAGLLGGIRETWKLKVSPRWVLVTSTVVFLAFLIAFEYGIYHLATN